MLKTVFFDLGNVLVFFDHSRMCHQIADCSGLTYDAVKSLLFNEKIQERYESGILDSAAVYSFFKARSPNFFSLHELVDAASSIFTPNTALWPVVEELKQKGIKLILLSNTSECHFNRIYAHYPIFRLFDDKVLSFEEGCLKPDSRIFLKALSRAGCAPEECFYIDDIPENIEASKKVGLEGVIFTSIPQLRHSLSKII